MCLDGARSPHGNGRIFWKEAPIVEYKDFLLDVSCAKTAGPMDLRFGLWTQVGRKKHKFNRIRQVAPMCTHGRAHWCHLANTIEPSVCGGDAALGQITLTTCLFCYGCPM